MTVLTEECVAPAWGPRVSDGLATARGFAVCTGPRRVLHTSLLSCLLFVGFLDPEKKLFSHRILSRDECIDPFSKTGNLRYVLATRARGPPSGPRGHCPASLGAWSCSRSRSATVRTAVFSLLPSPSLPPRVRAAADPRGLHRAGGCRRRRGRCGRESPGSLKHKAAARGSLASGSVCLGVGVSGSRSPEHVIAADAPSIWRPAASPPSACSATLTPSPQAVPVLSSASATGLSPIARRFYIIGNVSLSLCKKFPHFYPEQ